jgi:sulfate adenylyltransferase
MTVPPPAHGGRLKQLLLPDVPHDLERLPFLKLTPRQQCDVEMLMSGAFSPLDGFAGRDDYLAVLQTGRLADGTLWPVPVVFDVERAALDTIGRADGVLLLDAELHPVAVLRPREAWQPDRTREAKILFGTDDPRHAGARALLHETAPHYLGGRIHGLRLPVCRYLAEHRCAPAEHRRRSERDGFTSCLAVMPRHPLYRAGVDALVRALASAGAERLMLLHNPDCPAGGAPSGRVTARALIAVLPRLSERGRATYCRFGLLSRSGGVREAICQALVAQNYGATHIMLDAARHADRAHDAGSRLAAELLAAASRELEIAIMEAGDGAARLDQRVRTVIEADEHAALQLAFPEEIAVLRRSRHDAASGFALFLTGLSGAGKSSLAHFLADCIEDRFGRQATVLDGDYSRALLTSDLTAAPADRRRNVERHAYVAGEIVRHGGIAICALVAPEAAQRAAARAMIEPHGRFVEIYLAAPAGVCMARDDKGIYDRGRTGALGVAPPALGKGYEAPLDPEITLDSARDTVAELAARVLDYLAARRLLSAPDA